MSLFSFHPKAQPKQDHPSLTGIDVPCDLPLTSSLQGLEEISTENLMPILPDWCKRVEFFTPLELAAKREYVRRRFANGAKYSDHSEIFSFDGTLGEMAEDLGLKVSDKPLLNQDHHPKPDASIISKVYR